MIGNFAWSLMMETGSQFAHIFEKGSRKFISSVF